MTRRARGGRRPGTLAGHPRGAVQAGRGEGGHGLESGGIRDRIESGFAALGAAIGRRPRATAAVSLAVAVALISQLPSLTVDTAYESFLAEDHPVRVLYERFRDRFGRDDLIVLAVRPAGPLFSQASLERLARLHEELEREVPLLDEVLSLVNARSTRGEGDELIVEELLEDWPRDAAERAAVESRARGNALYRDLFLARESDWTLIFLRPQHLVAEPTTVDALDEIDLAGEGFATGGGPTRHLTSEDSVPIVEAVRRVVARHAGPDLEIRVAGGIVMGALLTEAIERDFTRLLGLAVVVIAVLLYLVFRRLSAVLLPLGVVILSLGCALGLMALFGIPIGYGTQILPSFLLAVGVGYSVHVFSLFSQYLRESDDKCEAVEVALSHAGLPIAMTALTTMCGLASFAAVELVPVAHLGIFAPVGVLLAAIFSIVLLPALLVALPISPEPPHGLQEPAERALARVGDFSLRHRRPILLATAGVIALSLVGASRIRFAHDPMSWFPAGASFVAANAVLDEAFGGKLPIELLVEPTGEQRLNSPELLERLERFESDILGLRQDDFAAGKVVGLHGIVKEIHQALHEDDPAYYAIPRDPALTAQELILFENSGSDDLEDFTDPTYELGRVTVSIPWADASETLVFTERVRKLGEEIFEGVADVRVTGLASLSNRTFLELIDSLTRSYALALVVISPLMILLIGSLRGGLVSLVPNLTPIVITLGMMGFLGIPLDLFTLLIGSVVLGLAVDDTIHFIHNYLRYLRASADPTFAVHRTLVTAGAALLFTSAALAAGFLVFVFAYLDNLARFGALVAFAIVVAFVADVVVTPALIVTMTRASAGSIARRAAAVALLVPLAVPGPVSAAGAPPTGRQIMEWVENRNDGDDATMDIDMVLIDRSGKRRERRLRSFVRDVADGTRQVLFFRSPASVRNTAFLTHDYDDPERDDDQWLYLPALHRTKRIASAERSGSFMGSDLTYADMSSRPLDRYDYRLVKEIEVRGHPVWVVEATPRTPEEIERTGYTRQLLLVRKDNHVVVRAVSWLQKADRLKYMDVRGLEQIDGIWVPTEVQVTTKTGDQVLHETILTSRNIVLNGGVDPEVFTLRRLEQGL